MVPLHMRILGGLGDPLEGLFLRTHGWMVALGQKGGTTGTNLRMRGMPVSTSTDALVQAAPMRSESDGVENW